MSKIKQTVEKVIHMLRHAQHETEKLQYFQALLRRWMSFAPLEKTTAEKPYRIGDVTLLADGKHLCVASRRLRRAQ